MFLSNVKFSVYNTTYSNNVNAEVMSPTPVLTNVEGTLLQSMHHNESHVPQGKALERRLQFELFCKYDYSSQQYLQTGAMIIVTSRRHPITKAWQALSETEQYTAIFSENVDSYGPMMNLHLVREGTNT